MESPDDLNAIDIEPWYPGYNAPYMRQRQVKRIQDLTWQCQYFNIARLRHLAKHSLRDDKKQAAAKELLALEAGWKNISEVIKIESRKLLILPRELRDEIYCYLYRSNEVRVPQRFDGKARSLMPPDPYGYLYGEVVDLQIAKEAAEILYQGHNILVHLKLNRTDVLSQFLHTDHYGSGVLPVNVLTRLDVAISLRYNYDFPPHNEFESRIRRGDLRHHFEIDRLKTLPLLDIKSLKHLEVTLVWNAFGGYWEFRTVSPILKILKSRGVNVKVSATCRMIFTETFHFADLFEIPTPQEYEEDSNNGSLDQSTMHILSQTKAKSATDCGTIAQWRVFLQNHYREWEKWENNELADNT